MGNLKFITYSFNKALRVLLFLCAFSNLVSSYAQNAVIREDNKLTYKNDESYKTISFNVVTIDSKPTADKFISLLKSNADIFDVSFDIGSKQCVVKSKLNVDKKTIINITGPAGFKTSEYAEKVNLMIKMPDITHEERAKIEYDREQQNRVIDNWPADFPKYVNTGNTKKDDADYAAKKAEWVAKNPEKYKTISTSSRKFEPETEKKERMAKENHK